MPSSRQALLLARSKLGASRFPGTATGTPAAVSAAFIGQATTAEVGIRRSRPTAPPATARTIITGPTHPPARRMVGMEMSRSLHGSATRPHWASEDATYKSSGVDFRPRRIILLRHGESEGNVDQAAYVNTADWRIHLTPRGWRQAEEAGKDLRRLVGDGQVVFYFSPYQRTRETLDGVASQLDERTIVAVREEPRISEQQIGNFQNVEQVIKAKSERHRFGRFFYRFPSGEAGLDVYSRVSSFISTLVRDCHQYKNNGYDLENMNVVIVTHGLSLRLFLMRWFQFSVQQFEDSENPDNAQLIVLNKITGADGHKWFELDDESRRSLNLPESCGVPKNVILHSLREDSSSTETKD